MNASVASESTRLARRLGFAALLLYGIGDILGAGIYALVGKVVGVAGDAAWISFLLSGALAAVTGLTYAEFVARVPRSAGAAAYCARAYGGTFVPFLVGLLVLASGLTSAATVSLVLHGYLSVLFPNVPPLPAALAFIALIAFLASWGIRESVGTNNALTCLEAAGLLTVIVAGLTAAADAESAAAAAAFRPSAGWTPVLAGGALAFYAFLGFEDLANLAEECRDPKRDLPRAILGAVAVCGVLYFLAVAAVLRTLPVEAAANSDTPLLDVLTAAGVPFPPRLFAFVALLAVANTGLANFIMASRLLYGMADQGLLPRPLSGVHPRRRTPVNAAMVAAVLCAALALTGGAGALARGTSLMLMTVFLLLHAGLLVVRRKETSEEGIFRAPGWTPYAGIAISLFMASQAGLDAYGRLLATAAAGVALYVVFRRWPGSAPPAR